MQSQMQTMNSRDSWTKEQVDQLAKALTFAYKTQTTYKEPLDLEDRLSGWRFILEEDFSMEQVLYGIKQFMKSNADMPVPAHITNVLSPEAPKITTAEYVQACQKQERNGYPAYSTESQLMKDYVKQREEGRESHEIECDKVKQIVGDSIQQMTEKPKKQIKSALREKTIETKVMPWEDMTLETMPDDVKAELIAFCIDFASTQVSTIYCRSYGIDYEQLVNGDT